MMLMNVIVIRKKIMDMMFYDFIMFLNIIYISIIIIIIKVRLIFNMIFMFIYVIWKRIYFFIVDVKKNRK